MALSKEEQKQLRRHQILTTALDLFVAKGIHGTSTREISKYVGISSGLMFHYFSSKEELYETLLQMGVDEMTFDLEVAMQCPYAFFEALLTHVFSQIVQNGFYAKMFAFVDQAQYTRDLTPKAYQLIAAIDLTPKGIPIIIRGQEMGQFRVGDPHALMLAFSAAIQGIAQEMVHNPDAPLPDVEWIMAIISSNNGIKNSN